MEKKTSGPGWILHERTYSMSNKLFNKISRREKSLSSRSTKDLRKMFFAGKGRMSKSQMIYWVMEKQFSSHTLEVYTNVKIEKSAPKKP